ncbi:FtsX-like permease family protein [Pallidibacillus pasinlerensis]|uniref:ABC3 transporter permease C-terminal domain-containing protein n=1 Tax=Pallidibacillus pasinlerensis TaxID=2703818 RepID=A0ABX0A4Z5_9BACI|nr:FtsX-like permease family protein [Pallidibacillus pasinlerensis]NCU18513.1 hypothetical protein [Pallidibacillus pasinlerensis]
MDKLYLKKIIRQKLYSFLFILAIIIIFIMEPLTFSSIQNIHQKVESDVTHYARGSYDLLVRTQEGKHPLEDQLGMVPENYIGFGHGGISIEQWETIKKREDIEIAAPVASLGYFASVKNNVVIESLDNENNRYMLQYYTTDGINDYAIGTEYSCFQLKLPTGEKEYAINHEDLLNECTEETVGFPLATTYHLLVAIDPDEEEKLTNISFAPINSEAPKIGWGQDIANLFPNATTIPIIEILNSRSALKANLQVESLELTDNEVENFRKDYGIGNESSEYLTKFIHLFGTEEYRHFVQNLEEVKGIVKVDRQLDFTDLINPFIQNMDGIYIDKDGNINTLTELGIPISVNYQPTSVYYRAGYLDYLYKDGHLSLKKLGEENGVPIYRDIEKVGVRIDEALVNEELKDSVTWVLDPVDSLEIWDKENQLASSPLGIYQYDPVTYISEDTGESIQLKATVTPGSFVSSPAEGVTNIQSAELIKGEKPIDAIRVKVAGITEYTNEAAEKIEKVAKEIEEMGLDVTIIAGASPQKVVVDVEGIGKVEESWTTLGAAGSIVSEWNLTNGILAIFFLIVILSYLVNRMQFWEVHSEKEILMMYQLGWEKKHINNLYQKEMIFLILIAAIISSPLIWMIKKFNDFDNYLYILYGITILVTCLIVFFFIRMKINKMNQSKKVIPNKNVNKKISLVWKNLAFFKKHIRPSFIQALFVSFLSSFVYISLSSTMEQTSITLLGEFVNLETNRLSLILTANTYILSIITLVESLVSLLKIRENEINTFRSIGWNQKHIFTLYLKEVAIWSGIAIAIGSVGSIGMYSVFYPILTKGILVILLSFVGLYSVVLIVASIVIHYQLTKRLDKHVSKGVSSKLNSSKEMDLPK